MGFRSVVIAVGIVVLLLFRETRGQFTTVINSPPTAIGDDTHFGSNTQVNAFDGTLTGGRLALGEFGTVSEYLQLNVLGGHVNIFDAWNGSHVTVSGGSIGGANLLGGSATMSGGTVRSWALFAFSQLTMSGGHAAYIETAGLPTGPDPRSSRLLITGGEVATLDATGNVSIESGTIGDGFVFRGGGSVEIAGGTIGDSFEVGGLGSDGTLDGYQGRVTVSGGSIGDHMILRSGRTLTFSGGHIGDAFIALEGSNVNFVGTEFFINGAKIANPGAGQTIILPERNVTPSGRLSDGSDLRFDLNDDPGQGDYFSPAAIVSIIFVPEPPTDILAVLMLIATWAGRRPGK